MKKSIICFAIILTLAVSSCGHITKEAPSKKMTGINGEAVYVFNKGDSIIFMFKEVYFNRDYTVMLRKDTVEIGEDLKGYINVPKSGSKITIESPTDTVFLNGNFPEEKKYVFTPTEEGVFDFTGTIEYDSTVIPFDYKFIVIRK